MKEMGMSNQKDIMWAGSPMQVRAVTQRQRRPAAHTAA